MIHGICNCNGYLHNGIKYPFAASIKILLGMEGETVDTSDHGNVRRKQMLYASTVIGGLPRNLAPVVSIAPLQRHRYASSRLPARNVKNMGGDPTHSSSHLLSRSRVI